MKTTRVLELAPIGVIHSPYLKKGDAPHQGRLSPTTSEIEIFPEFAEGLKDVAERPHLIILYWLDRADRGTLTAIPPHSKKEHGVFATRSPDRPNPIGFAVIDILGIDGNRLIVRGLDAFDGTPVLDIKPYSPEIDCVRE
ncbi:MAG: tRNA (N6-threonylcarbamoyladenosine(37)-N6)-methyltransferase TrmO [Deltaproteobacteria bacterium]|jgi:formylmethanofuran dehydrogenase subunit E|nr:MAG: tRNA (N6-threonylcarbamoyladenosine(37)-N6)-methyltransferase TrmO [Deltaproteobacteria bacterium]